MDGCAFASSWPLTWPLESHFHQHACGLSSPLPLSPRPSPFIARRRSTSTTGAAPPPPPSSSVLSALGRAPSVDSFRRGAAPVTTAARPSSSRSSADRRRQDLFPSDDSDYEHETRQRTGRGVGAAFTSMKNINEEMVDEVDGAFQALDRSNQTRSRLDAGDDAVMVGPFDAIADWVSDRFVQQSLQWKSSNINNNNLGQHAGHGLDPGPSPATEDKSSYIMESFSPGSTLDAIAQASSTYTPLSYQVRTVTRVTLPSILIGLLAVAAYPSMAHWLVDLPAFGHHTGDATDSLLYTDKVLTVLSNDLSQYVQNILTTCALLFGMLVGQTYYFMYQQQELVFYALFAEVTEAKSLLEQISLVTYGRPALYPALLSRMNDYVQGDLKLLSTNDPIAVTAAMPQEDPLESILYAISVGLPSGVYETVRALRQARADRCGALQRKLPTLHVYLLRLLGVIVLTTFPVCGSGSQAIAPNVLTLQAYMFGVLAFALTLVLNVVEELRESRRGRGAYNVDGILEVMVGGLEQELEERLEGRVWGRGVSPGLPARGTAAGVGGAMVMDAWQMDTEQTMGSRRDIGGDATMVDGGNGTSSAASVGRSFNGRPSPGRVKEWIRRKIKRR